jgi:hypothetical protein
VKPVIFVSAENFSLMNVPREQRPPCLNADTGDLEVRVSQFCPTWGPPGPKPKWWRRWFLREKQRPPERVMYLVQMP